MKKFQGLSLIELIIALAVGSVLLVGVLSTFVSMKTTSEETSSYGALQGKRPAGAQLINE